MKQLILFLLITLSTEIFAQQTNFPDSNAIWSVYNEKYFTEGDTLINSTLYSKFYLSLDSTLQNSSYFAAFREDTLTRRNYYVPMYKEDEKLLYDFSLSENDTISVSPYFFLQGNYELDLYVESVDSVLIGNTLRKRLKLKSIEELDFYDEFWIEGIGSTYGLFNSGLNGTIIFDVAYPFLLCFEQNEETIFQNPNFDSCFEYSPGVFTKDILNRDIKISPNPTYNRISIDSENTIRSYSIIDQFGREIIDRKINLSTFEIDFLTFTSGLYFIRFEIDGIIITKKIVKLNN